MSNLAKLKKKAAEFEQKKQFDKALALYVQILEESEGTEDVDVALYNRVGDLLLRQGSVADAVTYYEKAVDLYAEGGFFNNAIALCNKILRQSPGRSSIYYKLGKISAKKGFKSDAKANFLEYADRMQKAGQIDEAFRALKEFAELCPDQEDVRLMLAEQLAKKGRPGEALEQLQSLYDRFEAEGRTTEARATVDRMKAIDPDIVPKTGSQPKVEKSSDLVFLDVSWDDQPKRPMRATVPVRPPVEALEPEPPRRATDELPSGGDLPMLDAGTTAERPVASDVVEPLGIEPTHAAVGDAELVGAAPLEGLTATEFDAPDAGVVAADQSLLGIEHTALSSTGEQAIVDAGDALLHLEPPLSGSEFATLPLETPHDTPAVRATEHDLALPGDLPMLDLGEPAPAAADDGSELELIMPEPDLDFEPTERESDVPFSGFGAAPAPNDAAPTASAASTELLDFEIEHSAGTESAPAAAVSSPTDDLPLIDIGDSDFGATSAEASTADGSDLSDLDAIEPAALDFLSDRATADDQPSDGDGDVPLPTLGDVAEMLPPSEPEPVTEADVAQALPDSAGVEPAMLDAFGDMTDATGESPLVPEPPPRRRSSTSVLAQSVDALRLRVDAEPEAWAVRRQLGEALLEDGDRERGLAELEAAMIGFERIGDLDSARSVAEEIIRLDPNSVRHHQKCVEYAFRTNDRTRLIEAYLQLADALLRTEQADKSRAVYQRVVELAPDDARAQGALAALAPVAEPQAEPRTPGRRYTTGATRVVAAEEAPAASRPDDDFVNLGDWLRDDEGPKSTRMVVEEKEPTGDEEADFAEMLRKFKQGVAENVEEEDHESHYDLGVAFKEMGLLDEAIAEFQKALRGAQHRVRTYEALGQCFLEKQQYQVASTILQRALIEGHGDDQLVGVLYLLGYTSEALQQWSDAIGYYQRVFAVDIQFRDVTERLTALEQRVAR